MRFELFKKSNLDEMQEQKLLQLEHRGCWLAFWALFAALLVQQAMGLPFANWAGEDLVFLVLCFYLVGGSLKNGIWDRRLKPNLKTNLAISALVLVVMTAFFGVQCCVRFQVPVWVGLLSGISAGSFTAVLVFLALQLGAAAYRRRKAALEREDPDPDEPGQAEK